MKDEFVTKMTTKFGGGLFASKVQESMPRVTASHVDQSISINHLPSHDNTFSRDESFFASAAFKPALKADKLAKILP